MYVTHIKAFETYSPAYMFMHAYAQALTNVHARTWYARVTHASTPVSLPLYRHSTTIPTINAPSKTRLSYTRH